MNGMTGTAALYIFLLAGIAGYMLITRVPSILHTALMSGSNFVHGIATAGAIIAMLHADGTLQITLAFVSLVLATANAVGGYVLTDRILELFDASARPNNTVSNDMVKTSVKMLDADDDFINVPEQNIPKPDTSMSQPRDGAEDKPVIGSGDKSGDKP